MLSRIKNNIKYYLGYPIESHISAEAEEQASASLSSSVFQSSASTIKILMLAALPIAVGSVSCQEGMQDQMDFTIKNNDYTIISPNIPFPDSHCSSFMKTIASGACNVTFLPPFTETINATIDDFCRGFGRSPYLLKTIGNTLADITSDLQCFIDLNNKKSICDGSDDMKKLILGWGAVGLLSFAAVTYFVIVPLCKRYARKPECHFRNRVVSTSSLENVELDPQRDNSTIEESTVAYRAM